MSSAPAHETQTETQRLLQATVEVTILSAAQFYAQSCIDARDDFRKEALVKAKTAC